MGFNLKGCIMELIGTFALCYVGGMSGGGNLIGAAIGHGFVLGFMVYAGANISGSHYNPAVTLPLMIFGFCPFMDGLFYMIFQFAGGFLAGLIIVMWKTALGVSSATDKNMIGGPGVNETSAGLGWVSAAIVETTGTFFLLFTIMGTAVDKRAAPGIFGACIGGMLFAMVLSIGWISGCAINPTRFYGPKVAGLLFGLTQGTGMNWIVYLFPFGGGFLGVMLYKFMFLAEPEAEETAEVEVQLQI